MMENRIAELERELDRVAMELLPPLRVEKVLVGTAMADLLKVADEFRDNLGDMVPRQVVGKLWFVFTSMLIESTYTDNPKQIADAAWVYHEKLNQIFGPTF